MARALAPPAADAVVLETTASPTCSSLSASSPTPVAGPACENCLLAHEDIHDRGNRGRFENKTLNTREWFNGDEDEPKTHALSVCWGQNDSVIGWISLFGCMSYTILLAQRYRSLWMPISSCHHYDVKSLTIRRMPLIQLR